MITSNWNYIKMSHRNGSLMMSPAKVWNLRLAYMHLSYSELITNGYFVPHWRSTNRLFVITLRPQFWSDIAGEGMHPRREDIHNIFTYIAYVPRKDAISSVKLIVREVEHSRWRLFKLLQITQLMIITLPGKTRSVDIAWLWHLQ